MGLSKDLISQFVKVTNDTVNSKKETITYGTIADDGSGVYIDGADTTIPILTTANVDPGDRVIVMIKNHTATIIGNLSSPAIGSFTINSVVENLVANSITAATADITEKLTAAEADIDELEAANVTINGKLTAQEGEIATLKVNGLTVETADAKYATIEKLDATDAYIHNLEGTYAEFIQTTTEKLDAHDASIENLEASIAKINVLEADVAEIDTLIFGSATGNVIQTSFSNAVIAQLGDAQIKSAMIESISADKITAGDIITNDIRVMSEDGSLIISDETLQISDGTRVRVQIGKDAASDYSINIWDQNGNLMFSKGGITDAAIKEAIIRNDMVSDTANIHASKLDIDSLFEEINDSSNTIKSTKVYLDEKGQTLDVVFKALTTEVTDQGEIISSQGTAISTIQGQISSKIWQQDINTAKNEMSTEYSTLEQDVNGFKTTVSKTYATISDINNIKVGGRNFILGSRDLNGTASTNYNSKLVLDNGFTAFKCTGNWHGVKRDAKDLILDSKDGDTFTFSLNFKTSNTCKLSFYAMCYTADKQRVYPDCTSGQFNSMSIVTSNAAEEQDQRVYITFPVTQGWIDLINDGGTIDWTLQVHDGASSTNPAYLYAPKLERGNKPTDWTPAPEDAESKIAANKTLIEQTATDLTVTIESSAKTATNYLNLSSSGLIIGDLTSDTLGKNVLIDSDSVDIRNGDITLASFGADYLYLAKNSRNAKIDLCNGLATMYHESKYSYDTIFVINTGNTTEIMGLINPLCITSVDDLDEVSIQFANANGVMGGIGIVGNWLRRYGSNMYDKYTILDSGNYHDVMDSGWFYGGAIGDGFSIYADDTQIQYRKIGKIVHIRGAVKPTTDIAGSTTSYTLFTLPEGYRPSTPVYARCQGSSANTWLLSVTATGAVRFSRYGYGSTYVTATAGTWLPFDVTFFID